MLSRNGTVSFAFVVAVVDFTDLAVLCYLLITLKEKKTLGFFIRNNIEIVRMERDFSHFTWTSAWADFGHVLGNDTQATDRISFQIKTACFQINSIRFRVRNINDKS